VARRDSAPKPMLPEQPAFAPCASAGCRYPGRVWTRDLRYNERLCVNHYYRALEANPSLARDDTVPPAKPMRIAKPVAGE